MHPILLYVGWACGLGHPAAPPPDTTAALPAKTVRYYDAADHSLSSAAGAAYRIETTFRDSTAGMQRVYYASGALKEIRPYAHVRRRVLHGPKTTWYESGRPHTREDYLGGVRHGELLVYYPDGQLRRRDLFVRGQRTAGACFDPAGQPVPYFEYSQKPVYSVGAGDDQAIARDLTRNGIYPEAVTRIEMDAQVAVQFVIDAQGKVQQVRALDARPHGFTAPVVDEAFKKLQAEAVWLVQHLKRFEPARLDGEPVATGYSLVIHFATR
jgi:protein TonB